MPLGTVIVGSKIDDDESIVITTNTSVPGPHRVKIEMPSKNALVKACIKGEPKWANYIKGNTLTIFLLLHLFALKYLGVIVNHVGFSPSFQCVISSSVPTGGGLSSSASLEVAMYTFLDALKDTEVS